MRLAPGGSRARPAFPSRPSRHRPASLSSKGGDRPLTRAGARRPAGAHCPRLPSAPLTRAGGKQRIACLSTRSLPAMPPRPCRRCIPVAIARILRGAASAEGLLGKEASPRPPLPLRDLPQPQGRIPAAPRHPCRCGRPPRRAPFAPRPLQDIRRLPAPGRATVRGRPASAARPCPWPPIPWRLRARPAARSGARPYWRIISFFMAASSSALSLSERTGRSSVRVTPPKPPVKAKGTW